MKKLMNSLVAVTFLSMLLVVSAGSKARAQDVTVSYQEFYDELSPYGQWVYDPEYGNVWVPNEDGDFRPYGSRGHWVMTEYGNTWMSEDPWGWACYHYGRWTYNSYYGWIWIPGYEWAPAWVSWRYGGGYCGWAPMGPGWSVGESYGCPESWWVFVGPQYMYRTDYYHYWRGPRYNRECLRYTSVYNNVYTDNYSHVRYNYGPRASAIQQYTHQPVQVYRVSHSTRPGAQPIQQNTVSIYRPEINRGTISSARPANLIQAPRNIGRPEAHSELTPARQSTFRQEVIRQNAQQAPTTQPRYDTRNDAIRQNTQPPVRNNVQQEQGRNNPQQQTNRPEPQHFAPQPQTTRTEPVRNSPAPQQQPRQEHQHYNPPPQQQTRPEPQHYSPPPQQQRPEPQHYNPPPQQQQRPEPQHYNPPPQQQPRQQPQPSHREEESRPGGRR